MKMVIEKKCPTCGKTFKAKKNTKIYCRDACRNRAAYRRRANKPITHGKCIVCGRELPPGKQRYCSKACTNRYWGKSRNEKERSCDWCGEMFVGRRGQKYCSEECRNDGAKFKRRLREKPYKPAWARCQMCNVPFVKYVASRQYCCDDCKSAAQHLRQGKVMDKEVITRAADALVESLIKYQVAVHAQPRSAEDVKLAGRDMYMKLCRFCNLYDLNRRKSDGNESGND